MRFLIFNNILNSKSLNCKKNVCGEVASLCLAKTCLKDYNDTKSFCEGLMITDKNNTKVKAIIK